MSDVKMSVCGSCGFQWPTGQHGGHSCSSYLRTENASLKARIVELEALLNFTKDALTSDQAVIDTVWFNGYTTLCDKIELTLEQNK